MLTLEPDLLADDWNFELESPHIPALQLPYSVIARICHFLPTQGDKQRACLIHPIWSPAATDSLWQEPVFSNAAAFQWFYKTVHAFKRLALRVQALNITHGPNSNVSDVVKLSSLQQHSVRDSTLARPEVILALVRLCENVTSLKIYGWQIRAVHIERLSTALQYLKDLTIIGDNEELLSLSSSFRNLLTKLSSLRLDGVRHVNATFADWLDRRCRRLRRLHISAQDLGPEGFESLTSGTLPLVELVLTDCSPMEDIHVAELTRAFPSLRVLVLDGAEKFTGEALTHIFEHCQELEKLDIIVHNRSDSQRQIQGGNQQLKLYGQSGKTENLIELTIHGICLDTITVQSSLCGHPRLRDITLRSCLNLCDDDFRLICQSSQHLESVTLIDCPSLTSRTLIPIARSKGTKHISVVMIRCGTLSHPHIKQFSQAVLDRPSKRLVVSQSKGLAQVDYAANAAFDPTTQEDVFIFDSSHLDSLAQTDSSSDSIDGENLISQRTYTLDRRQVTLVAEQLGITSQQLRAAISKVLSNKPQGKKYPKVTHDTPWQSSTQNNISQSHSPSASDGETNSKPNSRISFKLVKKSTGRSIVKPSERPIERSTEILPLDISDEPAPAAKLTNGWNMLGGSRRICLDTRKVSTKSNGAYEENAPAEPVTPPAPSPMDDFLEESGGADNQKIVFRYQPLKDISSIVKEESAVEKSLPPGKQEKHEKPHADSKTEPSPSPIQLGGWGDASSPSWGDSPTNSFGEGANRWDATEVDRMTWQPAEVVVPPVAKGVKKKSTKLFLPASSEPDGWGAPPTERVAWDDDRKQGFAHDIIESQQQTVFWKLEGNVWKKLSGEQRERERQMQEAADVHQGTTKITTTDDVSPLKSASITRYVLGANSSTLDTNSGAVESQEQPLVQSNELSDDDEDVSDSDDGITIKTCANDTVSQAAEPALRSKQANIMDDDFYMDYAEPSFSTTKHSDGLESPPSHPGNPKWVSFDLWRKTHLASSIDHPDSKGKFDVAVNEGGWDDDSQTNDVLAQQNSNAIYDEEPAPAPNAPVASYKLVDILDSFNETMSMQSGQSWSASDIKWEGFESSMYSEHTNHQNDPLDLASPNKHEATVEYIKAQAESRQSLRNDIIRQTENDLISSTSLSHFESDESKYISNANSESIDSKGGADDDWISSSTSETGYTVSELGISSKSRRRSRTKEPRHRVTRHPMRPEKMAGQWGSFPIDDTPIDCSHNHSPSVPSLINVDVDECFTDGGNQAQSKPAISERDTQIESDHKNTFEFVTHNSEKDDVDHAIVAASPLSDGYVYDKDNDKTNSSDIDNITSASSTLLPSNLNERESVTTSRDFFDGLMDDAVSAFNSFAHAKIEPEKDAKHQETTNSVAQTTSTETTSPRSPANGLPTPNGRIVLSVKIETVGSGTQPLIIMEDDDPKLAIHEFCVEYGMTEYESKIVDVTLPRYKEKMAKRLLGRSPRSNSAKKTTEPPSVTYGADAPLDSLL